MLSIEVHHGDRIQIGDDLQLIYRRGTGRAWLNLGTSVGKLRLVESMPGLTLLERILDTPPENGLESQETT